ncbi:MAG: universal stress protein [Burkholderiaceae bacterium]|nr:universal stress protein [Burkholderiaceae bacterium]
MSSIRQILALIDDGPRADAVLALAAQLATRHGASVQALHAVPTATAGAGGYLSPEAAGLAIEYAAQADAERQARAAARVAAAADSHGLAIPLAPAEADAVAAALAAAHHSDLVVLAQHTPGDGQVAGFAGSVLVGAGAPLLFVPSVDALPADADGAPRCGHHVLVAWAPTRESTRALRDAMPLLAMAQTVELVTLADADGDEPTLDGVRGYLRRHGVEATVHVMARGSAPLSAGLLGAGWTPDVPVAEALLSHAADTNADLIVMGGYGHARLRELALGGVTRTMLKSMTVPVLMSH